MRTNSIESKDQSTNTLKRKHTSKYNQTKYSDLSSPLLFLFLFLFLFQQPSKKHDRLQNFHFHFHFYYYYYHMRRESGRRM